MSRLRLVLAPPPAVLSLSDLGLIGFCSEPVVRAGSLSTERMGRRTPRPLPAHAARQSAVCRHRRVSPPGARSPREGSLLVSRRPRVWTNVRCPCSVAPSACPGLAVLRAPSRPQPLAAPGSPWPSRCGRFPSPGCRTVGIIQSVALSDRLFHLTYI